MGIVLPVVKSLYLCDGHLGFSGQKTDLMGIFDSIDPLHYPHVRPHFVVFARLAQGLGTFPFWIEIRYAATGQDIAGTNINRLNFPNRDTIVNMVMTMNGVLFRQPGDYLVELYLDNQWVADTILELKKERDMKSNQQPNPIHQPDTFSKALVQEFECDAISPDDPEFNARERRGRPTDCDEPNSPSYQ